MSKKTLDLLRRPGRDPRTRHVFVVGSPALPELSAPKPPKRKPSKPRPPRASPADKSRQQCVRSLERLVDEAQAAFNEAGEDLRRCQRVLKIMRDGLPRERHVDFHHGGTEDTEEATS